MLKEKKEFSRLSKIKKRHLEKISKTVFKENCPKKK